MNRFQTMTALAALSVFASFGSAAQAQLALDNGASLTASGTRDYNFGATSLNLGSTPNPTSHMGSSMPLSLSYGSVNVDIAFTGNAGIYTSGSNGLLTYQGGTSTVNFSADQSYFAMRWSTLDLGNTIKFYNNDQLVSSVTGASVLAANLGYAATATHYGTRYTEFSFAETGFDKIVMSTTDWAFDLNEMAFGDQSVAVAPIPLNAASLGGLMSFLMMIFLRGKGGTQVAIRMALASIMPRRRALA